MSEGEREVLAQNQTLFVFSAQDTERLLTILWRVGRLPESERTDTVLSDILKTSMQGKSVPSQLRKVILHRPVLGMLLEFTNWAKEFMAGPLWQLHHLYSKVVPYIGEVSIPFFLHC